MYKFKLVGNTYCPMSVWEIVQLNWFEKILV